MRGFLWEREGLERLFHAGRQYPPLEVLSVSGNSAASWSCWRHWRGSAACGHSRSLLKIKRTKARQDNAASGADVFPILLFHTVFSKLWQSEVDWISCCSFPSDPGDSPARQEHNCCMKSPQRAPRNPETPTGNSTVKFRHFLAV